MIKLSLVTMLFNGFQKSSAVIPTIVQQLGAGSFATCTIQDLKATIPNIPNLFKIISIVIM